jgi:hypothetical protein
VNPAMLPEPTSTHEETPMFDSDENAEIVERIEQLKAKVDGLPVMIAQTIENLAVGTTNVIRLASQLRRAGESVTQSRLLVCDDLDAMFEGDEPEVIKQAIEKHFTAVVQAVYDVEV